MEHEPTRITPDPEAARNGPGLIIDHVDTGDHAAAIRALGKQTVDNIIEIGRRLTEVKRLVGHGNWLSWLHREFGWTDKTAENFINVHKLSGKIENFSNLDLPLSGLYLLAAPTTPDKARDDIVERAQAGEPVSVAEVKRTIKDAKGEQPRKKGWSRERHQRIRDRKRGRKGKPVNDELPTEEEAEASFQQTIYERACDNVSEMSDATRQWFFAHLKRKYLSKVDSELVTLATQAAEVWGTVAAAKGGAA